jgi:hypothetical protein
VGVAAVVAAALMIAGGFLPWFSANDGITTINRNAFQLGTHSSFSADGVILVVVGAIVAAAGLLCLARMPLPLWCQRLVGLPGLVAIFVAFNRYSSITTLTKTVVNGSHGLVTASVGYGFWLTVVGGAVAVAAGVLNFWWSTRPPTQAASSWTPQ